MFDPIVGRDERDACVFRGRVVLIDDGSPQSSICSLMSTGHGAAAGTTRFRLDKSYESRMSQAVSACNKHRRNELAVLTP